MGPEIKIKIHFVLDKTRQDSNEELLLDKQVIMHCKTIFSMLQHRPREQRFPHVSSGKKTMCNNKTPHKKLAATRSNERLK